MKNDIKPKPSCYYKYLTINKNTKDNILNNQIWFSNPLGFNDPFDCQIKIETECTEEELKKGAKSPNFPKQDTERFIRLAKKDPHGLKKIFNKVFESNMSKYGVSCFSLDEKNILMWSHYADFHKGICLKFDFNNDEKFIKGAYLDNDINKKLYPISEIKYVKEMPKINFFKDKDGSDKIFRNLVLKKSFDWVYEEEYRTILNFQGAIKYNKKALCEINFGCKVDPKEKNEIIKLVKSCNYPNVKFIQAKKSEEHFGLDFEEIPEDEVKEIYNS